MLAAAVLTLSGCAGEPDSGREPEGAAAPEAAVPEVVAAFAATWAEEDPWTATGFLCPDSPMDASELEVSGDPPVPDEAPIERIRIDGPPSPGPYEGGLVVIEGSDVDYHVPITVEFRGDEATSAAGALEITLGQRPDGSACVTRSGMSLGPPGTDTE